MFEYKTSLPKIPRGWKKWDGGKCPVMAGVKGMIIRRDGSRSDIQELASFRWEHYNECDTIAYRVCKPKKPVKNQKVSSRSKKSTAQLKTVTVKKRVRK